MAKTVEVTLDEDTEIISADAIGYQGKGCAAVIAAFEKMGQVKQSKKKPEFKVEQAKLQNK